MSGQTGGGEIPSLFNSTLGKYVDSTEAKVELFAEAFSGVSNNNNYNVKFQEHKNILRENIETDNSAINLDFTINELNESLSQTKNTSPGKDKTCFIMGHF